MVGALGWQGLVPGWLAGLVVGRDVALVAGMFLVRWRSLGWRVRGLTREEFFRVSPPSPTPASPAGPASEQSGRGEAAASPAAGGAQEGGLQQQQQQGAAAPGGVPPMRPLLISKANTVLQLGLVAGCLSQVRPWARLSTATLFWMPADIGGVCCALCLPVCPPPSNYSKEAGKAQRMTSSTAFDKHGLPRLFTLLCAAYLCCTAGILQLARAGGAPCPGDGHCHHHRSLLLRVRLQRSYRQAQGRGQLGTWRCS